MRAGRRILALPLRQDARDEHDPTITAKPFPEKAYIRELVRFWLESRMNIIEKSRQMRSGTVVRTSKQANCALYREGVNSKYLRNPFSRTFPMYAVSIGSILS